MFDRSLEIKRTFLLLDGTYKLNERKESQLKLFQLAINPGLYLSFVVYDLAATTDRVDEILVSSVATELDSCQKYIQAYNLLVRSTFSK